MIEKDKIEDIKRQTDIVNLISQYVQLKKVGKNYRTLCPFHSEKEPSFYVVPDKGIYYCFGCKKGGNAINFLMEYEKLDFPTAVKKLASALGIEIDTSKGLKYKELYEANDLAGQFYSYCLSKKIGKRGQNYLASRNIDKDALDSFQLGYAPVSGGLTTFMRQKGISQEQLQKAGLLSQSSSGRQKLREVFRDRVVFPIHNLSGRIIGFGGRSIDDHVKPKYLNSPETPIFKKGEVLYGLFQAKQAMRQKNEAILVEGYFDLLSLYNKGVKNVCAPLGTSLTDNQALLISRFAKKVNILFDGDLSGIKAALRAIGLLINAQIDVFVTSLPEGVDPDTFVHDKGLEELQKALESAQDFFHFYKKSKEVETVEQEVALIKDIMEIIGSIRDDIRFDRYIKYASRIFDIPVKTFLKQIKKDIGAKTSSSVSSNRISLEEHMMALILNQKEHFSLVKEALKPSDFTSEPIKRLFKFIMKRPDIDIADLSEITIIDEQLKDKLLSVVVKEMPLGKDAFVDAIVRYKGSVQEKRLQEKIAEARANDDEGKLGELQKELSSLKQKLLKIKQDKVAAGKEL